MMNFYWSSMALLLLLLASIIQHGMAGQMCAAPTLVAGALSGLGLKDYGHELQELDPYQECTDMSSPFRTFDGTCNNKRNLGAAYTRLSRLLTPAYDDGVQAPRTQSVNGGPLRSARTVSRLAFSDSTIRYNNTLLLMQWGQFLDHDMTLMPLPTERIQEEGGEPLNCCQGEGRDGPAVPLPEECFPILFDISDISFIGRCMEFVRTIPAMRLNPVNSREPREQINSITSFIDASSVYGSSVEEEEELREADGSGYLLKFEHSPHGPLLPRTERSICRRDEDVPAEEPFCFIAGDERVNEQPDLGTIHTIFLRLHNHIASQMAECTARVAGVDFNETVFQSARRVVGAVVQNIMYGEWLPIILGPELMEVFSLNVDEGRSQYDPNVDPSIINEFSTAAYRLGHSLVPRFLPTPNPSGSLRNSRIRLRDHFLRPTVVRERFNSLAVGLVLANGTFLQQDQSQALDSFISRELSRHLFEPESRRGLSRGQDLMSLNIQRGRDHGLQPYNEYRRLFGLEPVTTFTSRPLSVAFNGESEDIDLFVGGLNEPANNQGGQLGDTFSAIVAEQMFRLKFGDRFFFTHTEPVGFTDSQLTQLRRVSAAMVFCLTVDPITSIQPNAFVEQGPGNHPVDCRTLTSHFIDVQDFIVLAESSTSGSSSTSTFQSQTKTAVSSDYYKYLLLSKG